MGSGLLEGDSVLFGLRRGRQEATCGPSDVTEVQLPPVPTSMASSKGLWELWVSNICSATGFPACIRSNPEHSEILVAGETTFSIFS